MTDKQPLISCEEAVRQLWDFLDDAVAPRDHEQMDRHLAFCRRCCGELEFVKHLRELLARQATDDVPPEALDRLERIVEGM